MNIFSGYKYLFYRMYSWNLRTWGESDAPEYSALIGTSFLVFLNFVSVVMVFESITGLNFRKTLPVALMVAIFLFLVLINFFIFVFKGRYKHLFEVWKQENEYDKKMNLIWCVVYVVLSFATFFILV